MKAMRFFFVLCLAVFLGACTLPGVRSQAISRVSPPLGPVGVYDLEGDPNFTPSQLTPEMQEWHSRLLEGITRVNTFNPKVTPNTIALSGDSYAVARNLNVYVTSLLTSLRVTGDLAFLDEADRLMELARSKLADYNGDGFMNWRYLNPSNPGIYGDDYGEMDEILAHSLVAAVAAALQANEAFNPRYGEHAAFWLDYLQNDFEAKWRQRNDKPEGLPVLNFGLTHPYVQFIRYHHYMYQLTGDKAYEDEAERRAKLVLKQVREVFTPGGPGYVWDQRFLPESDAGALACQPLIYLQYTFQAFQDLAVEGMTVFDTEFMQRVATTMTELVMLDGYKRMAPDICGGSFQRGLLSKASAPGIPYHYVNFPYATIGKWDATGKLEQAVRDAYDDIDFDDLHYTFAPVNLPAEMLFLLANNPDSR